MNSINRCTSNASLDLDNEETPLEDLMHEHGLLNRILLIYEEIVCRLKNQESVNYIHLQNAAEIICDFIEGHHEKLEEQYIFPRLKEVHVHEDLVDELIIQHQKGRVLTQIIKTNASQLSQHESTIEKNQLIKALEEFTIMYRYHESREDTEIFPAFRNLISAKDYKDLGEIFEKLENEDVGEDAFARMLNKVIEIEKALDIYDISQFTPKN